MSSFVEFTKDALRIIDEFEVEGDVLEVIPSDPIRGIILSAIPAGVAVRTDTQSGEIVELSVGGAVVRVSVDMSERRKFWDGDVGLRPYTEAYQQAVKEREHVGVSDFHDDGDYIHLNFFLEVPAYADVPHRRYFSIAEILEQIEAILESLGTRATELARAIVARSA